MPNPVPKSGNCDVAKIWTGSNQTQGATPQTSAPQTPKVEPVAPPNIDQNQAVNPTPSPLGQNTSTPVIPEVNVPAQPNQVTPPVIAPQNEKAPTSSIMPQEEVKMPSVVAPIETPTAPQGIQIQPMNPTQSPVQGVVSAIPEMDISQLMAKPSASQEEII